MNKSPEVPPSGTVHTAKLELGETGDETCEGAAYTATRKDCRGVCDARLAIDSAISRACS